MILPLDPAQLPLRSTLMLPFKSSIKRLAVAGLFATGLLTAAHPAWARSTVDQAYPPEPVWSAAVRFLRVDMRFPVLEKDKEAGYILFDYIQDTKVYKASVELMALDDGSGRPGSRLIVTIPELPRHVEAVLLDKLMRKLKEELGAPPPPPRIKAEPKGRRGDETKVEDEESDRKEDKPSTRRSSEDRRRKAQEEDENAPVQGADGLPRLRTRDLPRAGAD